MKIAISSMESNENSQVEVRFGRAKYFMIYDTETKKWEVLENSLNMNAMQGAGIQTSQNLAKAGVEVVLSGHCGPNAYRTLASANIKLCTDISGTVTEALQNYQENKLKTAVGPDVKGHW